MLLQLFVFLLVAVSSVSGLAIQRRQSGCGSNSTWSFNSNGHYNRTINDRWYLVHTPANYDHSLPHPVVFSFHAFKMDPYNQEYISGFSEPGVIINNTGVIAVYPAATIGPGKPEDGDEPAPAWQGAPYAKHNVDDITFVKDMVADIQSHMCVDESRIYASGKSNGGGFTNLLACTDSTAKLFAAFAPVSAALYPDTLPMTGCNPGKVIPLINFHGKADIIIPFDGRTADKWTGNTSYALPNITQYREEWAKRNHCLKYKDGNTTRTSFQIITHPHKDTNLRVADCSDYNPYSVVNGFTVEGLGHSWPSTQGLDGGTTSFNATTANIIPFLEAQYLEHV